MKLPRSYSEDQPATIYTSNSDDEIILSNESLFKGKVYLNSELPDDVRVVKSARLTFQNPD
jgi:hypothetical protein